MMKQMEAGELPKKTSKDKSKISTFLEVLGITFILLLVTGLFVFQCKKYGLFDQLEHAPTSSVAPKSLDFLSFESNDERCPEGYIFSPVSLYCYMVSAKSETLARAQEICEQDGAKMASVHDSEENDAFIFLFILSEAYLKEKPKQSILLGLRYDPSVKQWKWDDGTEYDYSNWADGEPNHLDFEHNAVIEVEPEKTYPDGKMWNNVGSDAVGAVACKVKSKDYALRTKFH